MGISAGDVAVLRVVGRFQDQNVVNNLFYNCIEIDPPDDFALTNLCVNWAIDKESAWLARHSASYQLIGLKAFVAKGDAAIPGFYNVDKPGDVTGDPQESFVCRTLTRYTTSTNQRERGRIMLSGGTEDMFDDGDGSVNETELAALFTFATAMDEDITASGAIWRPCVYNRVSGDVNPVLRSIARVTPSVIRSRRIRQFLIG